MYNKIKITDIRDTRNRIDNLISKNYYFMRFPFDTQKIIIDALVYLNYKLTSKTSKLNGYNSVISTLYNDSDITNFMARLAVVDTINFQSVIDCYTKAFDLKNSVDFNIEEMLKNTDVEKYPLANLAIRLFLLRGNFNWGQYPSTDFLKLVSNDLSNIPSNAVLNCWEAVLVSLYQAKVLSLGTLKHIYNYPNICSVPVDVSKLFSPNNILDPSSSLKDQFNNKACIICFDNLDHVMLNVPFSKKQILRMLITQDFDEKPDKVKLFSLWSFWTSGKFDTVKKSIFKYDLTKRWHNPVSSIAIRHLDLR